MFSNDYNGKIQFDEWTVGGEDDGFVRIDEMVTWGGIETKQL